MERAFGEDVLICGDHNAEERLIAGDYGNRKICLLRSELGYLLVGRRVVFTVFGEYSVELSVEMPDLPRVSEEELEDAF